MRSRFHLQSAPPSPVLSLDTENNDEEDIDIKVSDHEMVLTTRYKKII